MKLKEIHLKKFKRFTDLTITAIPSSARLVVLVGPNGCGKSSVFDAFKVWQLWKGYGAQMVPSLVLMLHEYSSASEKKVRLLSKTTHFN